MIRSSAALDVEAGTPAAGPDEWCARGVELAGRGRFGAAAAAFRAALGLRPGDFAAWNNLGNALRLLGRPGEAVDALRAAARLDPNSPEAAGNLGLALAEQGRHAEALAAHRAAIRLDPGRAIGHHHLGVALAAAGRPAEALAAFDRAIALDPGHAEARNLRGVALRTLGRLEESVESFRASIALDPTRPDAPDNLGVALRELGAVEEALGWFDRAVRLDAAHDSAWNNAGIAAGQLGRFDLAEAWLGRAIALRPGFAEARRNRAMTWLAMGDYARGWPEYEWRLRCPDSTVRPHEAPSWDGSDLGGRTLLLHAEQGLGDTLQFVRFAAAARSRGAGGRVVLRCQGRLAGILARCPGVDRAVARDEPTPGHDVQAPLMSLPAILGTTLGDLPAGAPYVFADPATVRAWAGRLGDGPGLRVGLSWQGNPHFPGDRHRSIPLAQYVPLDEIPGVRLVSLQRGVGAEQARGWRGRPLVRPEAGPGRSWGFEETAAVMRHLDLVVTSDTAVAHLAGALGVPTWVALGASPDWRWLRGRDDSPWYPSMRLFRQERPGDWAPVFDRIARELRALSAAGRPGRAAG